MKINNFRFGKKLNHVLSIPGTLPVLAGLQFYYIGLILILSQCTGKDRQAMLQGAWRVDSVYSFYNGFGYMRKAFGDEPIHHFQSPQTLTMTKDDESRNFLYAVIASDSLAFFTSDNKLLDKFHIESITANQLILKKDLRPVFQGENQTRFERHYFSKVD